MNQIDAMRQAREVLKGCLDHPDADDAITALSQAIEQAADMLEADDQNRKDSFASGMACRPASVQEADGLTAAAQLALDALTIMEKNLAYVEITEAITALKEALKNKPETLGN